ncbi:hypothetical protein BDQ17DRAFT_1440373 [Cyathus striatus]|nr:hypothetical protein BDQ17DRAFT_1440373 [Cyathus striatus]
MTNGHKLFNIPPAPVVADGKTKNQAIDFDDNALMSSLTNIDSDSDTNNSLIPSPGEQTIKKPPGQTTRNFRLMFTNWQMQKLDTTQCLTQQESQKLEMVYRAAELLPSEIQGTHCPNYTFFLDFSVPYWSLAPPLSIVKNDGSVTFRPDTKVSPIIWSEPLTAQSGSHMTPPPSYPPHPPSSNANSSAKPAWKAFLESHKVHYEARCRMETDAQHQQDGNDYVRVRVHSKYEKELVFEQFSEQQMVYNAYDNEWDLCYEFGPDVESDEVEEDDYPETEYEQFHSDHFQATTDFEHVPPLTQIEANDSDQHADEYECEGDYVSIYTLKYMYGFTPGAAFHPGHVEYNWEHSMMALGYIAKVTQPSHVDDIIPIIHFTGPLSYGYSSHLELWNLRPENCLH